MNSMDKKIEQMQRRRQELHNALQDLNVSRDTEKLKSSARELRDLDAVLSDWQKLERINESIAATERSLNEEADEELKAMAREELGLLMKEKERLESMMKTHFSPKDPMDGKNILVEIRPGAGGDEAALFAAELFRLYSRFAEKHGLTMNVVEHSRTDIGGLREAIFELQGRDAYRLLKFESGVHRVQRVPETEKSGRVHTSTATVAVLPEPEAVDIELKPDDLKIEATTSSGHGGQSVNTTYSAIRMTHLPTGITVSCQDERSQKQNKEKALQIMRARVFAYEQEKKRQADSAARKSQIGTGDRSEKIRTYNVPQDRVTDHRIKQNFPAIASLLDGNLDPIVDALTEADRTAKEKVIRNK